MTFKLVVKKSFARVKQDMNLFKESINEWIMHLHSNQAEMKAELADLRARVKILEAKNSVQKIV